MTPNEALKAELKAAKRRQSAAISANTTKLLVTAIRREIGADMVIEYEYAFASDYKRKWRHDLYLPAHRLAIEIEGGAFTNGRHTRGVGYTNDIEKYNFSTLMGNRLLRFTTEQVNESPVNCARQVRDLINKTYQK